MTEVIRRSPVVTLATKEQVAQIKAFYKSVKGHFKPDPMALVLRKYKSKFKYLELGTHCKNTLSAFDPLAQVDLPGEVGDVFLAFDRKVPRRVIVLKGQHGHNVVLFDRRPATGIKEESCVSCIAGSLYSLLYITCFDVCSFLALDAFEKVMENMHRFKL